MWWRAHLPSNGPHLSSDGTVMVALVRHGEPRSYRHGGLTLEGRAQIAGAAWQLAATRARGWSTEVWTSPAARCRESAAVLVRNLRCMGIVTQRPRRCEELGPVRVRTPRGLADLTTTEVLPGSAAERDLGRFWEMHYRGDDPFALWEEGEFATFEPPTALEARLVSIEARLAAVRRSALVALVTHAENIRLLERRWGTPVEGLVDFGALRLYRLMVVRDPGVALEESRRFVRVSEVIGR